MIDVNFENLSENKNGSFNYFGFKHGSQMTWVLCIKRKHIRSYFIILYKFNSLSLNLGNREKKANDNFFFIEMIENIRRQKLNGICGDYYLIMQKLVEIYWIKYFPK